jgi:hypothetical protein
MLTRSIRVAGRVLSSARGRLIAVGLAVAAVAVGLGGLGGSAAAAGRPHVGSGSSTPAIDAASVAPLSVWSFRSAPLLHPMKVKVLTSKPGTAAGLLFVDPYATGLPPQGENGSLIMDNAGNPIWFKPLASLFRFDIDFRVQQYRGQPVLTMWQGIIAGTPGHKNLPSPEPEPGAKYLIYNDHYRLIRTVTARNGWTADQHEFLITPQGDALFTVFKRVPMNLKKYGGPKKGAAIGDYGVQEINLATGKLVFSWDILKHVSLTQSHIPSKFAETTNGNVWDAYHINSLDPGPNGTLLISSRNAWAVFDVKMSNGQILWQLGGQQSTFKFPQTNATFYWQHMVELQSGNEISMFDDGCCEYPRGPQPLQESHGLVIHLNMRTKTASEVKTYYHSPALQATSEGSNQILPNGDALIGWGDTGYISEYSSAGNSQGNGTRNLLYDVQFPGAERTYRVFRDQWVGTPYYPPSAAVRSSSTGTNVYASWNGSTQTAKWRVLAGPSRTSLSVVAPAVNRKGFETVINVNSAGPFFRVQALGSNGQVLGISRVVKRPR